MVVAQPKLNVKCGGYAGIITSKTGKTHQEVEDVAVLRAMPGMVTLAPADGWNCDRDGAKMETTPVPSTSG